MGSGRIYGYQMGKDRVVTATTRMREKTQDSSQRLVGERGSGYPSVA